MKLEKLTIHNIASIADAEIDFTKSPLSDSQLFLICGDTGAGKTTILDAVSLALYGKTPRFANDRTKDASKELAGASIDKVEQIIRRNTVEAYSELIFSENGKQYNARWVASRAKNKIDGTLKTEKRITDVANQKDVAEKIDAIIGLTFDQFCRTTMLAQGEFTKFLFCTENEKAEILEKLTNTSEFAQYGVKIFNKYSQLESELKSKNEVIKVQENNLFTKEEVDRLAGEIITLEGSNKTLKQDKENLTEKKDWIQNDKTLREKEKKSKEKKEKIEQEINSESFLQKEKLVSDWAISTNARNAYEEREKAKKESILLDSNCKSLETSYSNSFDNVNWLQSTLQEKKERHAKGVHFIESQKMYEEMFAQEQTICAHLENITKAKESIETFRSQKEINEKLIKQFNSDLIELQKKQIAAKEQNDEKQREIDAKTEVLRSKDKAKLDAKYDSVQKTISSIKIILEKEKSLQIQKNKTDSIDESIKQINTAIQINRSQNKALESTILTQEKLVAELQKMYDKLSSVADNAVQRIKNAFSVGDTCPVCGQTIKKLVDVDFSKGFKTAATQLQDAKNELENNKKACIKNDAEYAALKKNLVEKENERKELQKTITNVETEISQDCGVIGVQKDKLDAFMKQSELELQKISAEREECRKLEQTITTLQKEKNTQTQPAFEKANKTVSDKQTELQTTQTKLEGCSQNIQTETDKLDDSMKKVKEIISYANWETEFDTNAADFIQKLRNEADIYKKSQEALQKIATEISAYEKEEKQVRELQQKIVGVYPKWETISHSSNSVENKDIVNNLTEILQELSTLVSRKETVEKTIKEKDAVLQNFYNTQGCDESFIVLLTAYNNSQIDKFKSEVDQARKDLHIAIGEYNAAQKDLVKLQEKKPQDIAENDTVESIGEQIKAIENQILEVNQKIGENQSKIETNEKSKAAIESQIKERDELQIVRNQWKLLNDKLGDKEGKTFRGIIQTYILQNLLASANVYLDQLSNRYQLDSMGLSLTIIDNYENAAIRPIKSLSGGESFLVSLAMALALSNINKNGFSVEMLFIDEGFGTLSGEHLNTVMTALEQLKTGGNRKIGIISHVEGLRDRIKTHIQVTRNGHNASKITVVDKRIA